MSGGAIGARRPRGPRVALGRLALTALGLAVLGSSAPAEALTLGSTSAASRTALRVGVQVFARGRGRKADGGELGGEAELTRARLKTSFRYGRWLRADVEPDFGGAQADLADVFLRVTPIPELDLQVGQAKSPFGLLEIEGRWRLPVITRGIVSDVVRDRLGFGGRHFGTRLRWRGRGLPLRPELELGAYGDDATALGDDVTGRLALRLTKGLHVHLAGSSRVGAAVAGARGHLGALSALFDRRGWWLAGEAQLGRVRLTGRDGLDAGVDATILTARLVAARRFTLPAELILEPFLGAELLEPNLATRDDLGVGLRAGLNLLWHERLRLGLELDRQLGQTGAIIGDRTSFTGFLGLSLE